MISESMTILLVEDDPGHAVLIQKNLRRARLASEIVILNNGEAAINYLFGASDHAATARQNSQMLVLLDLNLPILDGYQVLKRIKADERTKHIPVVVLSTTDDPREINRCYNLGCNMYIAKPVGYEQFSETLHKLGLLLSIVLVPQGG